MSAPLIWIGLPMILAMVLWFLHRRGPLVVILAGSFCLLLALLAWLIPIASVIKIGPFSIEVSTALEILGRRLILDNGDRAFLRLIYLLGAFWFFGAAITRAHRFFAPFALGIITLMVAALAVEPFLYAALLIEMAVLLSVPMLVNPGQSVGGGVLRYLIFQTLAMPFILFAGWAAAGVEANPANERLLLQVIVLLGLGFSFWLAIFPFYSWIPLLVGEVNHYVAGFVLSMLPTAVLLLALDFLNAYTWLRESPLLIRALSVTGTLMVLTAGIWAAFERDLTRLLGYAVIAENGFALLALSLHNLMGYEIFAASFLPRLVVIAIWALALEILKEENHPTLDGVSGLLRRSPLVSLALLFGCFSIAGLPLMAEFPVRQALYEGLASGSLRFAFWGLIGSLGFMVSGFRLLAQMGKNRGQPWQVGENWPQALYLAGGIALMLGIGVLPGWFLPSIVGVLDAFPRLP